MTRQETQIIKGIALIMMLWLHLFSNAEQTLLLDNFFVICGTPLSTLIARACPPVGFFVFCGGYGLYYTYRRGKDKHYLSRIVKLFIAYWLVLLICISLCIFIVGVPLKLDSLSIFYNVSALQTSWDYPCWFLFPYALLSLSYPLLFSLYDRVRIRYFMPPVFILNFAIMVLLHAYGTTYINHNPILSVPVSYLGFLFLFFCGATFLRCDILTIMRKAVMIKNGGGFFKQVFLLLIIVVLKILINSAADGGLYTIGIILVVLLTPIKLNSILARFLEKIGNHSMNMWMIHYMLYAYILHDQLFGMRYPVLIFMLLVIFCYLSSIILNIILNPIYRFLKLT